MKYYTLILFLFFNINSLFSQSDSEKTINTYDKAIDAGKKAVINKEFEKAINYFFAAEAYAPSQRSEVKRLIDDVFNKINGLKEEALKAQKEAIAAQLEAEKALEQAKLERERAEKKEKEAKEAEAKAVKAKEATVQALKVAEEATEVAKRETAKAVAATKEAEAAKAKAEEEKNKAETLRVEAVSTATALKSISLEKEDKRLKALLAIEAYNMQKTIVEDTTKVDKKWLAAEAYTCLYDALVTVKGKDFDQVTKEDDNSHLAAVRAIMQPRPNQVYTLGSDGKLILWNIKEWKINGKPEAERVSVHDKEEVYTTASMDTTSKNGTDRIAIGGRFSEVQLLEPKIKGKIFSDGIKSTKPQYKKLDLEEVQQLEFQGNHLYALCKNSRLIVYNTVNDDTVSLEVPGSKHFSLHPNGGLMAIGVKNGIHLLDLKNLKQRPLKLNFAGTKLAGKEVSVLKFDTKGEILSFGTTDGFIGLIFQKDNSYDMMSLKTRKTQDFLISAIDFKIKSNMNVMAVGSYDGTVSIWIVDEFGNEFYTPFLLKNTDSWATSLIFINSGNDLHYQLMVGYFNGTVKFWNLSIKTLANGLKCELANVEPLTIGEKSQMGLNIEGFEIQNYVECKN
jgi:WD40 repeat protein